MFFSRPAGHKYISSLSSEPDQHHFTLEDFIRNQQWHDLDLSSIVGSREVLALITGTFITAEVVGGVLFDTKNTTIKYNNISFWTQVAGFAHPFFMPILTDENGCIKYKFGAGTWTLASVSVIGYFVK